MLSNEIHLQETKRFHLQEPFILILKTAKFQRPAPARATKMTKMRSASVT